MTTKTGVDVIIKTVVEGLNDIQSLISGFNGLETALAKGSMSMNKAAEGFDRLAAAARQAGQENFAGNMDTYAATLRDVENGTNHVAAAQIAATQTAMDEKAAADALAQAQADAAAEAKKLADAEQKLADAAIKVGGAMTIAAGATFAFLATNADLSARVETLGVVIDTLGRNVGKTEGQMRALENSVMDQGITMQASRTAIAKMIQSQIDLANSTQLARVAQDAAVIANIDSSEAFERLITVIARGEPRMARTMGLIVGFQAAYKRAAAEMGKTTQELTEVEKVQIRVNEVIRVGATIEGAYESAMETAGKKRTSLNRLWEESRRIIGDEYLPVYEELIDITYNGLTAFNETEPGIQRVTAALLGITAATVGAAGTALVSIGTFVKLRTTLIGLSAAASAAGISMSAALWPITLVALAAGIAISGLSSHVAKLRAEEEALRTEQQSLGDALISNDLEHFIALVKEVNSIQPGAVVAAPPPEAKDWDEYATNIINSLTMADEWREKILSTILERGTLESPFDENIDEGALVLNDVLDDLLKNFDLTDRATYEAAQALQEFGNTLSETDQTTFDDLAASIPGLTGEIYNLIEAATSRDWALFSTDDEAHRKVMLEHLRQDIKETRDLLGEDFVIPPVVFSTETGDTASAAKGEKFLAQLALAQTAFEKLMVTRAAYGNEIAIENKAEIQSAIDKLLLAGATDDVAKAELALLRAKLAAIGIIEDMTNAEEKLRLELEKQEAELAKLAPKYAELSDALKFAATDLEKVTIANNYLGYSLKLSGEALLREEQQTYKNILAYGFLTDEQRENYQSLLDGTNARLDVIATMRELGLVTSATAESMHRLIDASNRDIGSSIGKMIEDLRFMIAGGSEIVTEAEQLSEMVRIALMSNLLGKGVEGETAAAGFLTQILVGSSRELVAAGIIEMNEAVDQIVKSAGVSQATARGWMDGFVATLVEEAKGNKPAKFEYSVNPDLILDDFDPTQLADAMAMQMESFVFELAAEVKVAPTEENAAQLATARETLMAMADDSLPIEERMELFAEVMFGEIGIETIAKIDDTDQRVLDITAEMHLDDPGGILSEIQALSNKTIVVTTIMKTIYETDDGIGNHSGADFIVPPGYPNDTFGPLFVESGEHVTITPTAMARKKDLISVPPTGSISLSGGGGGGGGGTAISNQFGGDVFNVTITSGSAAERFWAERDARIGSRLDGSMPR